MNTYILAAAMAIGFACGYYLRDLQADAELVKELKTAKAKEQIYLDAIEELEKKNYEQSEQQRKAYEAAAKQATSVIVRYKRDDCTINTDVTRMLNNVIKSFESEP